MITKEERIRWATDDYMNDHIDHKELSQRIENALMDVPVYNRHVFTRSALVSRRLDGTWMYLGDEYELDGNYFKKVE